jgi:hypothetical protein
MLESDQDKHVLSPAATEQKQHDLRRFSLTHMAFVALSSIILGEAAPEAHQLMEQCIMRDV